MLFAQDLEKYHLDDIAQGLAVCGLTARSEGETAFPDMGTMKSFISPYRDARADREAKEATARELEALKRDREEHPEQYETTEVDRARMDALNAKLMQRATFPNATTSFKRHIEATETKCPHCDKALPLPKNMRMWTADQVLEFGAQLKEIERLAEANREETLRQAHAAEVLAEVVA